MISDSEHPPSTSAESTQTAAVAPPARPPRKIIPFHTKCKPISHSYMY